MLRLGFIFKGGGVSVPQGVSSFMTSNVSKLVFPLCRMGMFYLLARPLSLSRTALGFPCE